MLTIDTINPIQGEKYYQQENYYSKGKALENSEWWGLGAGSLGLSGQIKDDEAYKNLLHGYSPDKSQQLRGKPKLCKDKSKKQAKERAGFDLCFAAPKSVSLACLVGGDRRLESAHQQAIKRTLEYIECLLAATRIKGEQVKTGNLTVAIWHHDTSRELDPHLHSHCIAMNFTQLPDKKWQSLWEKTLYQNKMLLGQIYRNELALECRKLGYEIERQPKELFEIKGYTREQIEAFSKRHEQIIEKLKEVGKEVTTENKVWAWRQTRVKKNHEIDRAEMRPLWSEEAALYGITHPTCLEKPSAASPEEITAELQKAVQDGIEHCSERKVAFKTEEITRFVTAEARQFGIQEIQKAIASHPELIQIGDKERRVTTQAAFLREVATIKLMQQGKSQVKPIAHPEVIDDQLEGTRLNLGQRSAVTLAATTTDQFIAWQGVAGAGKTFALKELKRVIETQQQITQEQKAIIKAFAPSAEAATVLGEEMGIEANTVARLLVDKQPSQPQPNQIWIVDEAGLMGAKDGYELLKRATAERARVILVGDTRQLSSVEAGSPFRSLQSAGISTAYLTELVRQKDDAPDLQKAVQLAATGDTAAAISHLMQVGKVEQVANADERARRIAKDYIKLPPKERDETLMAAGTNKERIAINEQVRSLLKAEGSLGYGVEVTRLQSKDLTQVQARYTHYYEVGDVVIPAREYRRTGLHKFQPYVVEAINRDSLTLSDLSGNTLTADPIKFRKAVYTSEKSEIAVGDKLRWTKNDNSLGRRNGQQFTVRGIESDTALIEYKNGLTEQINLQQPLHLDHAYLLTYYPSQGKTAKRTIASAAKGRAVSGESGYVVISRAKSNEVKIYAEDEKQLLKDVQRSGVQENPIELLLKGWGRVPLELLELGLTVKHAAVTVEKAGLEVLITDDPVSPSALITEVDLLDKSVFPPLPGSSPTPAETSSENPNINQPQENPHEQPDSQQSRTVDGTDSGKRGAESGTADNDQAQRDSRRSSELRRRARGIGQPHRSAGTVKPVHQEIFKPRNSGGQSGSVLSIPTNGRIQGASFSGAESQSDRIVQRQLDQINQRQLEADAATDAVIARIGDLSSSQREADSAAQRAIQGAREIDFSVRKQREIRTLADQERQQPDPAAEQLGLNGSDLDYTKTNIPGLDQSLVEGKWVRTDKLSIEQFDQLFSTLQEVPHEQPNSQQPQSVNNTSDSTSVGERIARSIDADSRTARPARRLPDQQTNSDAGSVVLLPVASDTRNSQPTVEQPEYIRRLDQVGRPIRAAGERTRSAARSPESADASPTPGLDAVGGVTGRVEPAYRTPQTIGAASQQLDSVPPTAETTNHQSGTEISRPFSDRGQVDRRIAALTSGNEQLSRNYEQLEEPVQSGLAASIQQLDEVNQHLGAEGARPQLPARKLNPNQSTAEPATRQTRPEVGASSDRLQQLGVKRRTADTTAERVVGCSGTAVKRGRETERLTNELRESVKALAEQVRELPLEDVAARLGLELDRHDKHKWRGEGQIISITDQKFYDHLALKGGYGALDLVMHVQGRNFKEALDWLTSGASLVSQLPQRTSQPKASIAERPPFQPPTPVEEKWHSVRRYLVETRGLPPELVDELHSKGIIYAANHQKNSAYSPNAVFLRTDSSGQATGANLRSTDPQYSFKGLSPGTKRDAGWFRFVQGEGKLTRVVLTESPIDAISLAALEAQNGRQEKTIFISIDGAGEFPQSALQKFINQGGRVEIAFDADQAGSEMAQQVMAALPHALRVKPVQGKDWNEQLLGVHLTNQAKVSPPVKDEQMWADVHRRLWELGLPDTLIEEMHQKGVVYADPQGHAVFSRTDSKGETTGAIFGTFDQQNTFRETVRTQQDNDWFRFTQGEGKLTRAVLTKSPIDSLSLAALEQPKEKTIYISIDRAEAVPQEALQKFVAEGGRVEMAFDASEQGNLMADRIRQNLQGTRVKPTHGEDWNKHLLYYQQMWRHYNSQAQAADGAGKEYAVGKLAAQEGHGIKDVAQMIARSPAVDQMRRELGPDEARNYIGRTVSAVFGKEQQREIYRSKPRTNELQL